MKITIRRFIILFGLIGFISVLPSVAQSSTYIASLAWNPTSSVLASGGVYNDQRSVWLIDETGQVINQFSTPTGTQAVSWRPDGNIIAAYGSGEFTIWDPVTGSTTVNFSQQGATQDPFIHWNPANFNQIATVEADLVHIRDVATGQILTTLDGDGGKPDSNLSAEWSQDGSTIYTVSTDDVIRVWDVNSATVTSTSALDYGASAFALSPDRSMLAIGGGDGQVRIHDTSGALLSGYSNLPLWSTNNSLHIVWNSDSTEVASVVRSGIEIWDVDSAQVINTLPHLYEFWSSIAVTYSSNNALIYPDAFGNIVSAPIAFAGSEQTLTDSDGNCLETVMLDGSLSSDSDGRVVSYEWFEDDITIATGVNPQVTFDMGVHHVILTVIDDDGVTASDVITITVQSVATSCDSSIAPNDTASLIVATNIGNNAGSLYTICLEYSTYNFSTADNSDGLDVNSLPNHYRRHHNYRQRRDDHTRCQRTGCPLLPCGRWGNTHAGESHTERTRSD